MSDSGTGMDMNTVVVDIWCVVLSNVVEMEVVPAGVVGLLVMV